MRCYSNKHPHFSDYGGRGIVMAPEWKDDYPRFLADMGPRPAGHSLDRFPDVNGNYESGNCRWATDVEQHRNKRSNRRVTFNGETLLLIEWAERYGLGYTTLRERLRRGWDIGRALTEPLLNPAEGRWKDKTQAERDEAGRRLVAGRQKRRQEQRIAAQKLLG